MGAAFRSAGFCPQLNLKSEFISGLRVTDKDTRDVALMVLAGKINKQLVTSLSRAGRNGVGIDRW